MSDIMSAFIFASSQRNVTGDECQTPFDFFESFKELGHCNA
jgi:hypothetical protein